MKAKLKTIISEKEIQKRIREMGEALNDRFRGQQVVAVCVSKGPFVFFADLIRLLNADMKCEFMGLSSYGDGARSSGEVKITLDLTTPIEGKHVLLIEDIIDTGLTMSFLQKVISARKPKTVTTVTLLHKPDAKKVDCQIDLVGFTIKNEFVVGFGLDYQNRYRELPYIARVENLN